MVGWAPAGVLVAGEGVLLADAAAAGVFVAGAGVLLADAAAAGEVAGEVAMADGATAATTAVGVSLGDRVRVGRGLDAAAGVGTCTPTS